MSNLLVLSLAGLLVLLLVSCPITSADDCMQSGSVQPDTSHSCEDCCKAGQTYPTYQCSPPTSSSTNAIMTLNDFSEGGDGGDKSECDEKYHSNTELVVALSTGWYSGGSRCLKNIMIYGNGMSVLAKVVDECDSMHGCDSEHAYQPPCRNNIVDASQAVWDALNITGDKVGEYDITWSDAE